jgi:hypothetical protein
LGGSQFKANPGKEVIRLHLLIEMKSYINRWAWYCVPVIPATQENTNRRISVQAGLSINWGPISKITNTKRTRGMAQVVEPQTLSSNPQYCSPTKKRILR